jgi:hypothetical protein
VPEKEKNIRENIHNSLYWQLYADMEEQHVIVLLKVSLILINWNLEGPSHCVSDKHINNILFSQTQVCNI